MGSSVVDCGFECCRLWVQVFKIVGLSVVDRGFECCRLWVQVL
jgi:hypothetical protein